MGSGDHNTNPSKRVINKPKQFNAIQKIKDKMKSGKAVVYRGGIGIEIINDQNNRERES